MLPKCPAPSKASGKEVKRLKATITLQKKVELLDMFREKKNFAAVTHHYSINESTLRYIQKNEAAIRRTVSSSFHETAKNVSDVRNKYIVRMESALALWINDCRKK
uniref:HTH psq-type domain-containing protein n=1 Tax=Electrophorus electricus TaxID=8005 RepID=A0A4W4DQT7_ELEEL